MLLLDVDGVLTDGGITLIGGDAEAKRFDAQDGMGITLARAAGLRVGIITSRSSDVVRRRAGELGIEDVYQGYQHKSDALTHLLERYGVEPGQAAYMGDDVPDIAVMKRVGIPIAVRNAIDKVKDCSVHVTEALGGHGAVREAVEWLLELRGDREQVYAKFTDPEG